MWEFIKRHYHKFIGCGDGRNFISDSEASYKIGHWIYPQCLKRYFTNSLYEKPQYR